MMKKFAIPILALLFLALPNQSWASSATAISESQVEVGEGQSQVYQSVETTVNGQTVKKESTQPGKLELKMEQTGEGSPTVTFSQEEATSVLGGESQESGTATPPSESVEEPKEDSEDRQQSIFTTISDFLKTIWGRFLGIFG